MKNLLFYLFLLGVCAACQNKTTAVNASADSESSMSDHADDPDFRAAHDEPRELNFTGRGEMMDLPAPSGDPARAYVLRAADEASDRYLFVIQEWWGLNDYVKAEAERLASELDNVHVVALDMYDGKVATKREQAQEFMQGVEQDRLNAIVQAGLDYAGPDANIGTIGWCFGGGWSLKTSIAAGDRGKACVMYYGQPVQNAAQLAPLEAPVLGIFAEQDGWVNEEVVGKFEQLAAATNKDLTVRWFDADHAFANPTQERYDAEAAEEANRMATAFLAERLGR